MKTIQDVFFETADSVRAIAAYNRMIRPDLKQLLTPVAYAKEFCTCQISCGRQSGASSWIAYRARPSDLVVVCSVAMAEHLKKDLLYDATVVSCQSDLAKISGHEHYNTVWVDNPTFVFERITLDRFMNRFATRANEFVFVGS